MNHPEHILRVLDRHLTKPTRLVLYGRAALALGYPDAPGAFHATMDVDAILPEVHMAAIEADDGFWNAIENTNLELLSSGLYITHLFSDTQLIIRSEWLDHLVDIDLPGLRFLKLQRPSTEDLILTKMMRIDPQDRSDICFLLGHNSLDSEQLDDLLKSASIPPVAEIQEAFLANSHWLRASMAQG
jgi:hypothetical protein